MSYELRKELPTPERFQGLRAAADMAERSPEGVERGLSNSLYGVTVVDEETGDVVGMARVVGDGAPSSTSATWPSTPTTSARASAPA